MPGSLAVSALGATSYREGLAIQDALVRARAAGEAGDWLLYPDHPPVLTVGRNPSEGNLLADPATLARLGVEVFEVPRGGDVTWHGPGQLVGYPIIAVDRVGRDLHRYLRLLEEALIRTLARWEIASGRSPGRTGVWVGERKIASIGVAVRRWVGYHGFALNVSPDLAGFSLIHPCGLKGVQMTSMAELLGDRCPAIESVRDAATAELAVLFEYDGVTATPASEVRALAERYPGADNTDVPNPSGPVPVSR